MCCVLKDLCKKVKDKFKNQKSIWTGMLGFGIFSAIVFFIWLAAFWAVPWWMGKSPDGVGTAGDMFGIVTSLFSGLAFAGLLSTLMMQRHELELQRAELALSRDEFKLQRFENTLFGLLRMFNEHVMSLKTSHSKRVLTDVAYETVVTKYEGRSVVKYYSTQLDDNINMAGNETPFKEQKEQYCKLYDYEFESDLGPYFRLLYNTIRHIEKSGLNDEQKQSYSKIVRAYLSSAEVKLLMFNCATEWGADFKDWVAKYKLLKHLRKNDAKMNPSMVDFYGSDAFDGRYGKSAPET